MDFGSLATANKTAFGSSVIYARGAATYSITAVAVPTNYEVYEVDQTSTRMDDRDYEILVADLAVVPAVGDTITQIINSVSTIFEVVPGPGASDCYEYKEPDRLVYVVHTKER